MTTNNYKLLVICLLISSTYTPIANATSISEKGGLTSSSQAAAKKLTHSKFNSGPHIFPVNPYIQVDGNIRSYFFDRDYTNNNLPNQRAFSLGGKLNLLTEEFFYGFRLGATGYTAQPLGINSHIQTKVDRTLPGKPVGAFGQAFGQYENKCFLARIGNQLITTPWMNEADSRMIPATYQAVYAKLTPITDFNLSAMRVLRFKNRISSSFSKTNLYNPSSQATPIALADQKFIGAFALGADYKHDNFKIQAWGYQFYNIAKLYYADASYKADLGYAIKPIMGIQLGHEHNDGNIAFNTVNRSPKNSDLLGVLVGIECGEGSFTVGYNDIPKKAGAYLNGNIISPYTTSYTSDPLYTTSMIAGLIEKAAGHATKVTLKYNFFDKKLKTLISYAKYYNNPSIPNTSESNFDITYLPDGMFKKLALRYRVGLLKNNPTYGQFIYHRAMLQYDFD